MTTVTDFFISLFRFIDCISSKTSVRAMAARDCVWLVRGFDVITVNLALSPKLLTLPLCTPKRVSSIWGRSGCDFVLVAVKRVVIGIVVAFAGFVVSFDFFVFVFCFAQFFRVSDFIDWAYNSVCLPIRVAILFLKSLWYKVRNDKVFESYFGFSLSIH